MARQPLFVHENTLFTERMVVKSGKSFLSAGSGDGTAVVSAIIVFTDCIVTEGQSFFLGGGKYTGVFCYQLIVTAQSPPTPPMGGMGGVGRVGGWVGCVVLSSPRGTPRPPLLSKGLVPNHPDLAAPPTVPYGSQGVPILPGRTPCLGSPGAACLGRHVSWQHVSVTWRLRSPGTFLSWWHTAPVASLPWGPEHGAHTSPPRDAGEGGEVPPPPPTTKALCPAPAPPPRSRAPSLCPATVSLAASASLNGICNRP